MGRSMDGSMARPGRGRIHRARRGRDRGLRGGVPAASRARGNVAYRDAATYSDSVPDRIAYPDRVAETDPGPASASDPNATGDLNRCGWRDPRESDPRLPHHAADGAPARG